VEVRDLRRQPRAVAAHDDVEDPVLVRVLDRDRLLQEPGRAVELVVELLVRALGVGQELQVQLVLLDRLPDQLVATEHLLLLLVVVGGAAHAAAGEQLLALAEQVGQPRLDLHRRLGLEDLRLAVRVDDRAGHGQRDDRRHQPRVLAERVEIAPEVELEQRFGDVGGWAFGLQGLLRNSG
jgi:hypothetical protein